MTHEERTGKELWLVKQGERGIYDVEAAGARYANRISEHMMQECQERTYNGDGGESSLEGNVRMFGSLAEICPPQPGGAWCIETPFSIFSEAAKGAIREKYVILRTWSDQSLTRSIEMNMKMVTLVMGKFRIPSDMKFEIVSNTIICWLRLRGQFFWLERDNCDVVDPDSSMFFDNNERKLKLISSSEFKTWLHAHSGINPANARLWKEINESIKTTSTNPQISKGVKPGVMFDRRGDVVYISCGPSEMARVDKDGVRMVSNGTDGVVFALGKTIGEWELLEESEGKNPFTDSLLYGDANYASPHGRTIAMLWFLGMAACMKNYPIILFQGRYRSGKTRCGRGILNLLGIPDNVNSIQENGEEDLWALIDSGIPTCFDNVDGAPPKWFANDIQVAATGGAKTKRKMYTDKETVTLGANSKIILTANDPKFLTDSGVSDRVVTVELNPFTAECGKVVKDEELVYDLVAMRSAAMTWVAWTISHALADTGEVKGNLNRRHPDFAKFALHCARALGIYEEGVKALMFAEFNKSYKTVITDRITMMVFEVIRSKLATMKDGELYEFTSSDMLTEIRAKFAEQIDESDRQLTNKVVGRVMNKHLDELRVCFKANEPRVLKGITRYGFTGFTDEFKRNVKEEEVEEAKVEEEGEEAYDELVF